ncbi:MAG: hypothetical protein IKO94_10260, partial [Selenomonadaceae bacterium]|nr:hypothetical protein [Selenomonadaceae bacterium]
MTESLGTDEAWTKSFNTRDGELKFQMRKIAIESDDKRFNFIVKCGKDTVYKRHFPKVNGGYSFMAMKDTSNSRLFFVLQSKDEAYLYGYESINGKFEVYIDSQNYLNKYHGEPRIAVMKDGGLV